jgi:dTDP-glucose pyrophosphorylase
MINIVIPMSGRGQRFVDAGYKLPKPFIPVNGKPMIQQVIENLWLPLKEPYKLIFLCLSDFLKEHGDKFKSIVEQYNNDFEIIEVKEVTEGAACTVLLSEHLINNNDELVIANCDQLVEDRAFLYHSISHFRQKKSDGGIICFLNDSPKWSYCRLSGEKIIEVIEKQVISNIATIGVYYYKKGSDFVEAAKRMISNNDRVKNEFYVCPVYNYLIADNKTILPYMINDMIGLGTPSDLEHYLKENNGNL